MDKIEEKQLEILNLIKSRQISADEGYRRIINLRNGKYKENKLLKTQINIDIAKHQAAENHVLFNEKVMTMDGLLDIVYSNVAKVKSFRNASFKNVILKTPLKAGVNDNSQKSLVIEFNEDNGEFSVTEANGSEIYMSGVLTDIDRSITYSKLSPDEGLGEYKRIEEKEIYNIHSEAKIGDFYRNIKNFMVNGDKAVYRLIPQEKGSFSLNIFAINSIIVAALKLAQTKITGKESFCIPIGIECLEVLGNLWGDEYRCCLELNNLQEEVIKVNAQIVDSNDLPVLHCKNLYLKKLEISNEKYCDYEDKDNEVAIVGVSGKFPGAHNIDEFWELLENGRVAIKEVPKERWDIDLYYDNNQNKNQKTYCRKGGFLKNIDKFDARFFNITDKEAELMDPQQRLFLEECWNALEDSGYATSSIDKANCGVFVGVGQNDYQDRMKNENIEVGPQSFWGNDNSVLASRISYYLNLKGPSIAVNTACSSSLVSIHMACKSIITGECDMALAGGVFIATTPGFFIASSNANMLSADGNCYAFDHRASGFVPGEGVGVIVLKSKKQAIKDKDNIYGVIVASAVNQDGKTNGITAPSSIAQSQLEESVYKQAGVNPETISYIETHGTGTPLGDPIEFEALSRTFRKYTKKKQFCAIGSVKVNIGHAANAAGIASAIKSVLMLKNNKIPPYTSFEKENPNISFKDSSFYVNKNPELWDSNSKNPLRIAVSSFGFSGTNCHILMEGYSKEKRVKGEQSKLFLFPFSANTEEALKDLLRQMLKSFEKLEEASLEDICYTLSVRRKHFKYRIYFLAASIRELAATIKSQLANGLTIEAIGSKRGIETHKINSLFEQLANISDKAIEEYKFILKDIGELYKGGYDFDFRRMHFGEEVTCISLPTYCFQRRSYWINEMVSKDIIPERVRLKNDLDSSIESIYFSKRWVTCNIEKSSNEISEPNIIITDGQDTNLWNNSGYVFQIKDTDWLDGCKGLSKRVASLSDENNLIKDLKVFIKLNNEVNVNNIDDYSESLVKSFILLFNIVKALQKNFRGKIKLVYMYTILDDQITPFFSALEALGKSIELETPNFSLRIVEKSKDVTVSDRDIISDEYNDLGQFNTISCVKYKENKRMLQMLSEIEQSEVRVSSTSLRVGGTYIITGGLKGIGYIIATYLARRYKARLILVGRSAMDDTAMNKLDNLRELGSYVRYYRSDVSNYSECNNISEELEKMKEVVNGIFHCAGITKDSLLKEKTDEEFQSVFAPKIQATLNILNIFKSKASDFIMLFSSTTSLFGSIGQTDYAYANCFMDKLAQNMTEEVPKIISVNYFYWKNGGMRPNEEILRCMQTDYGLHPLLDENGMETVENCLKYGQSNILVLYGNKEKINNALSPYLMKVKAYVSKKNAKEKKINNIEVRKKIAEKVEEFLRTIISKESSIPVSDIDSDLTFDRLGLDSLMITNLNIALEKYFPGIPKTVFFEFTTIRDLAKYLCENYEEVNEIYTEKQLDTNVIEIQDIAEATEVTQFENSKSKSNNGKVLNKDIAVIGLSGIYPMASNIEEYWSNLKQGKDCISEIPRERWDYRKVLGIGSEQFDKDYCKYGGFISEYDRFDPLFFNISPKEAEWMDPQERLFVQEVWHALENSGYTKESLQGKRVGVFVGVTNGQYQMIETTLDGKTVSPLISYASLANRISYLFNFSGPSLAIDTMCSSFITAMHYANESLIKCECDIAVVGSANLILHENKYIQLAISKFASPKGKCHSFGKEADGYVPGEGVGAVVLKPLIHAEIDKDYIYGVIKGTSINHGGKTNGYTVPNPKAQAEVILEALRKTNINPEDISYIEAHGAGTPLGDPIEIDGLSRAFEQYTNKKQFCSIGSVKSNIGHLEAAAGIAGLTKVLLQLTHKTLVPTLHIEETNPNINFSKTPFYLQKTLSSWKQFEKTDLDGNVIKVPRIAGISAFGAGGANGHIIVQEYNNNAIKAVNDLYKENNLFIFSASDLSSLKQTVSKFNSFIKGFRENSLSKIKEDVFNVIFQVFHVPQEMLKEEYFIKDYGIDFYNYHKLNYRLKELSYNCIDDSFDLEGMTIHDLICKLYDLSDNSDMADEDIFTMRNISYTLQVGREALKQRLAVVADSKEQLQDKLEGWLEGKVLENVYCSENIKDLKQDGEGLDEETIEKMLYRGELVSLAEAWILREHINWNKLKRDKEAYRIPISGYVFKDEHYLVQPNNKESDNKLHPLVGKNVSNFERFAFSTEFNGKEFFLNDHVLLKNKVLPGMAYLEAARYAASQVCSKGVYRITNMIWSNIFKMDSESRTLSIALNKEDKWISCEFSSQENEERVIHGNCRIMTEDLIKRPEDVDIELIKMHCGQKVNGEDLYSFYKKGGLNYGAAFKIVKEVYYNECEALSLLSLPKHLEGDFSKFILHPSMMDAAFQGGICIKADYGESSKTNTYIPFFLEEVSIYAALDKECYSHVTIDPRSKENENLSVRKLNCKIISKDGRVLVELKGFTARAAQLNKREESSFNKKELADKENSKALTDINFYYPQWTQKNLNKSIEISKVSDEILIFNQNSNLVNQMKGIYNGNIISIKEGEKYYALNEEEYTINSGFKQDYISLFKELRRKNKHPKYALFCWFMEESNLNHKASEESLQNVEYYLGISAYSLLSFLQAWDNVFGKLEISIVFCLPSEYQLKKAIAATVRGFANSLQINMSNVNIKLLDCCCTSDEYLYEKILKEMICVQGSKEIVITDSNRYEYGYDHKPMPLINSSAFREGGTYIVTGGMGEIGKILCNYLTEKYHANLVILGRSNLNEKNRVFIEKLKRHSEKIVYYECDITDEDDMDRVRKSWNTQVGAINGVIHIAGIMSKNDVLLKNREEFMGILKPKVIGTILLEKSIKDEKIDFFLSFSSTASMLGDYGRCDYSAANNFLDEYTKYREELRKKGMVYGKSFVINWPTWEDGGMHVGSMQAEKHMLQSIGMSYIKTKDAIKVIETVLCQEKQQVIIMVGEEEKVSKLLSNSSKITANYKTEIETSGYNGSTTNNELELKSEDLNNTHIQDDLKEMIGQLLKIEIQRIECDENLESYGFNSVTITELCGLINKKYNTDLNPTVFFEYQTIDKISTYIYGLLRTKTNEGEKSVEKEDELPKDNAENNAENNTYLISKNVINSKKDLIAYMSICADMYKNNTNIFNVQEDMIIEKNYNNLLKNKKTLLHMLVEIDKSHKLEVMILGKGPVLLIIPGFGISGAGLINQLTELSKYYQVVIVHLPGSGFSDGMPDLLNPLEIKKVIIQVLDELCIIDKISVMAFSFGGLIAQELVKSYPERFNMLILGCSFTRTDSAETAEESLENKFKRDFENTKTKKEFYQYYLMSKCVNRSSIQHLAEASLKKYSTVNDLHKISVPSLVISGSLDAVVDSSESNIIANGIPKAIHINFKKGGHCVNLTNSGDFNKIVKMFIDNGGYIRKQALQELKISEVEVLKNYMD